MRVSVASLVALLTCAQAPTSFAAGATNVPAVRITAPTGQTSVMLGSVHVGVAGLSQPDVQALFRDARLYVVEQVPGDGPPAPPRKLGYGLLLPDGTLSPAPWAKWMTQAQRSLFEQRLACNFPLSSNVSPSQGAAVILAMSTPLTASEIAIRRCAPAGVASRDELLQSAAVATGLRTVGLEREADVEALRQSVPDAIYIRHMQAALAPDNELAMRALVQALNIGDYDAVLRIVDAGMPAEQAATYRSIMLDKRNADWMFRLSAYLEQGGVVINVGAAHLGGRNGLLALLKERGYKVEEIKLLASQETR